MIKTKEEYTNACDFIDSDMELYDFNLSEKMTSYEYNLYLQDAEYFLNFLYEKIRTLEELCDYLENYADTKIRQAKQEMGRALLLTEQSLDIYANRKAVADIPEWNDNISRDILDRDGSIVPVATVSDYAVEAASNRYNFVRPQLFSTPSNDLYSCIENIDTGEYLISIQASCEEEIQKTQEVSVQVMLPANAEWNNVSADPVNCTMEITNNEAGILITLRSHGYDKERRLFSYPAYTKTGLNQIKTADAVSYDPYQTIAGNRRLVYDARAGKETRDYMQNVMHYQDMVAKQQQNIRRIEQSL